ncbi:Uncharacterised protein [Burkholderia pseudomallei]|uniref:hypothetical protein n=1 Tax=Burkholderia pseudomallei TaxID=28450 RepID=UPI0010A8DEE0|nr:hypothetical protein [Burkholderia pseudomallei]MBF3389896.1 hypothetical protein [Burkholderia pseudomallei]MBF3426233.1 hypothetical protein [Burkholderia pseudomallei]MBF3503817.1 hypothetical protein [Burkholderia pseudomallei]MBF3689918.1 hypothetical protein [Burkholderia pseudomallei]MBF3707946.1 hypothetical protein [Burkholderia pseudomallei]
MNKEITGVIVDELYGCGGGGGATSSKGNATGKYAKYDKRGNRIVNGGRGAAPKKSAAAAKKTASRTSAPAKKGAAARGRRR